MTSAALVMISALPVAIGGEQDEDDRRPGDEPGRVELVEDVGHAQHPVEADRREREAAGEQRDAGDVEHGRSSERARRRVTWRAATSVAVNDSSASASAASM